MQSDTSTHRPFDPDAYLTAPHLTAEGTVALAAALVGAVPKPTPDLIERLSLRLAARVREAEDELAAHRDAAPPDYADDVALDAFCDGLWSLLRDRLRSWSVFEHPSLGAILAGIPAEDAKVLRAARNRAARAHELLTRLLGTEGLAFTDQPYPEQAQRMAAILRMVDEEGLVESIDELVGPEVLLGLRHCQTRYEAMVAERMLRDHGPSVDLRPLRRSLSQAINRYARAVLTMLDENDLLSIQLVRTALHPIDEARNQARQVRPQESDAAND